ncbi:MAG: hypothetical protein EAZ61_01615 [Oscillatoriales cyanobacterium]|nr:MAG: hypothetical protein EAZ61_01615 [Oscillatoriales cyanobacterium]
MPERSPDNYSQPHTDLHADRLFVHDTALIATSVQLQTCAPYCIEIGAGVVIGEGCWLHACSGDIIIESGTVLGVGVLIVGWAKVGALALIGSAVTLFETTIEPGTTIAAHSVHGLPERAVPLTPGVTDPTNEVDNLIDPWDDEPTPDSSQETSTPAVPPPALPSNQTPVPSPSEPPTPPQASNLHLTLMSGVFIQNWQRPKTNADMTREVQPDHGTAQPNETFTHPEPSQPTTPLEDRAAETSTATSTPDDSIAHASTIQAETPNPMQDESPQPNASQPIDPAIEARPAASNPEPPPESPQPRSQNVYGRQHVNRIIDSILQRHHPDTST